MAFPPSTCIARFIAGTGETVSGGRVSQWDDQTGNGNHAVQATGSAQPYSITNSLGKAALRCDTGDFMTIGNGLTVLPRDCALFFIGRVIAGGNITLIGLTSYAGSAGHLRITSGVSETNQYRAANRAGDLQPSINDGLAGVLCRAGDSEVHTNTGATTGLAAITVDATPRAVFFGTPDVEIYEIIVCNSGTMAAQDLADLKAHAVSAYGCPTAYTQQIVFEGDSISAGFGLGDTELHYPAQCLTADTDHWRFNSVASSGANVASAVARAVQTDGFYEAGYARNVLLVLMGRNDLPTQTAADFYTALVSYVQARVAAGWEVWVGTLTPETAIQSKIDEANARIRGDSPYTGIVADAGATLVVDFAALTISTSDGTHPNNAGAATMAGAVIPLLTPITLTAPADASTTSDTTPTFTWEGGTANYTLKLVDTDDDDHDFDNPSVTVTGITGTSHTLASALTGTNYDWRVEDANGLISEEWSFAVVAGSDNHSRTTIAYGIGIGF